MEASKMKKIENVVCLNISLFILTRHLLLHQLNDLILSDRQSLIARAIRQSLIARAIRQNQIVYFTSSSTHLQFHLLLQPLYA